MTEGNTTDPALARELLDTFSRFDRVFHASAQRFMGGGLKPGQAFLLFILTRQGTGMRVSDLACRLHVTASNVTQAVTDLEEKGLVERKKDPSDRRVVMVSLSARGKEAIDAMRRPYNEKMEELVASLGPERARTLIALLGEVEDFYRAHTSAGRGREPAAAREKEYPET